MTRGQGVSSMLKENQQGLIFGAEGEKEVKYTINLGKLLSIYKNGDNGYVLQVCHVN